MLKKPIGIGIENYKRLIEKPYYYVDKTLMIKELLDQGGSVIDNRHYFDGMKIMDAGEEYLRHMGRYPVISMSLKSAKQPDYHMAYESLKDEIIKEYIRHNYILDSDCLTEEYYERYYAIMNRRAEPITYAKSLGFLSECLRRYHKTNVVILLDEYDVPLENAFFNGFYKQMMDFTRSLFESALKTNDCLQFAIVTGCLRISRESIFTGLNNLEIRMVYTANRNG